MGSGLASLNKVFDQDGLLSEVISGYQPRQSQLELANGFLDVIGNQQLLIAEAGTGTGKTFAYLIPAILSGKKSIISTGTKNLQEQLFHRDLPVVIKALKPSIQVALLKGRANYLCTYRLRLNRNSASVSDKKILTDFTRVSDWANQTKSGDIGELTTVNEQSGVFPLVTSTVDNCLGKDCPDFEDCYLAKARKKAQQADLVVINHHLYFADLAVKDTGFGEILPDSEVMVFDEAHQLPEIACEYFGERFASRQMIELGKDVQLEYRTELKDVKQLGKAAERLIHAAQDFRLQFPIDPEKGNWRIKGADIDMQSEIEHLTQAIEFAYQVIKTCVSRTKGIDSCFDRCVQLKTVLEKVNQLDMQDVSLWYETTPRHFSLNMTPLSIADKFSNIMSDKEQAWLMTSATLSVGGGFEHFTKQLGLVDYQKLILPSPFDYPNQSMMLVPRYFPEPNDKSVAKALAELAVELVDAAKGRTFLLFTSHRMMNLMAQMLERRIDNPILVQGTTGKRILLEQFVKKDKAVLLATGSFWEGVDVRGDALKCVLIDKLPFAAPDDPLIQAKIENCKRQGRDAFAEIQLPQAVITLKQGAGRLIRDVKDKGVLVICDPRLVSRHYGQIFIDSLPDMARTRSLDQALAFLKRGDE